MEKLQLEGATFLLPLTLLPAPGPGTLAAVTHLRPPPAHPAEPYAARQGTGFFHGHLLAPKHSGMHSC